MKRLITQLALPVLALLIALPGISFAQEPVKHEKDTVTVKATIDSIDHDTRMVTLKDKDGKVTQIYAGPEVRRFDELKVGDVVLTPEWRLLGSFEAVNGIIMFGWSTALVMSVVQRVYTSTMSR